MIAEKIFGLTVYSIDILYDDTQIIMRPFNEILSIILINDKNTI